MRHTELLGSFEAAVDSASITRFSRVLNAVGGWVWWVGVLHPVARDGPTTIRSNWGRKLAKLALVLFLFFKSVRPLRRDLAFRISASRGSCACARLTSLRKQAVTTVVQQISSAAVKQILSTPRSTWSAGRGSDGVTTVVQQISSADRTTDPRTSMFY